MIAKLLGVRRESVIQTVGLLQKEGLIERARGRLTVLDRSSKDAQYTRKQSIAKQPYFVLNSTNGETIGSSQMYTSSSAMESGIASVKENGATKTSKDNA